VLDSSLPSHEVKERSNMAKTDVTVIPPEPRATPGPHEVLTDAVLVGTIEQVFVGEKIFALAIEGVAAGASSAAKSTLLVHFGDCKTPSWPSLVPGLRVRVACSGSKETPLPRGVAGDPLQSGTIVLAHEATAIEALPAR
jgi:hypothetical protein